MIKKWEFVLRNSFIYIVITECVLGFSMAVVTFRILPVSIDQIGILPAFFGLLIGILLSFCFRKIATAQFFLLELILFGCLIGWFIQPFPFYSYWENGIFHSIFSGVFLSYQANILSGQRPNFFHQKTSGISYLLGLVLGILLK